MTDIETFLKMTNSMRSKVTVVGDYLLDEYYYVLADRVSPEFPIPVMLSSDSIPDISIPGGAGNVCRQMEGFNVDVDFYSLIDTYGLEVLNSSSISSKFCVLMEGKNPIKKRIYQDDFPLCRWDIELTNFGLTDSLINYQRELHEKFCKEVSGVVIFSDYGKGLFNSDLNWMCNEDLLTIVDPKNGPIEKWKGCTIFKPNEKEAHDLSGGLKDWKKQCDYFMSVLGCSGVVITRGRKGVVGKMINGYFDYKPDFSVACESSIGAGDTFAAFLAMTQVHCMDIIKSVEIAWKAGSIYVQKKHNKPVHPYELLALDDPIKAKFVSREFLSNRDFDLVFTNGCFDFGLHSGHLKLLHESSKMGKLVVALNSDESVSRLKGKNRPLSPLKERMKIMAALECVDYVVSFEEDTPYEIIKEIRPDVLVKGGDYKKEDVVGADLVEKLYIVPSEEGVSTTKKIEEFKNKLSS